MKRYLAEIYCLLFGHDPEGMGNYTCRRCKNELDWQESGGFKIRKVERAKEDDHL
jgi:hypothetical protein